MEDTEMGQCLEQQISLFRSTVQQLEQILLLNPGSSDILVPISNGQTVVMRKAGESLAAIKEALETRDFEKYRNFLQD